ncbi:MAG: hypothetical protein QOI80_3076 [Solirubrobacteraceae bacterium]|jgi:hypothetical protein|nr:hypothetical protein [Solirubrobacteraceae bacterium]
MRRIVTLAAAAAVLAGCGGGDAPSDEARVRDTLRTFATAVEKRDYQKLCDEVFAPKLLQGLQSIGLPCEIAMRTSLGEVKDPKLTVGSVTVSGKTASAQIKTSAAGQPPSTDTIKLEKVASGWRVSALGAAPGPTGSPAASASAAP